MSDLVDKALHAYDDAEIVTCGGVPCEATEITSPRTRMGAAIATVLRDMREWNKGRVQKRAFSICRRHDELCREGKHGNTENIFRVVREEMDSELDTYASENGIDLDQGEE